MNLSSHNVIAAAALALLALASVCGAAGETCDDGDCGPGPETARAGVEFDHPRSAVLVDDFNFEYTVEAHPRASRGTDAPCEYYSWGRPFLVPFAEGGRKFERLSNTNGVAVVVGLLSDLERVALEKAVRLAEPDRCAEGTRFVLNFLQPDRMRVTLSFVDDRGVEHELVASVSDSVDKTTAVDFLRGLSRSELDAFWSYIGSDPSGAGVRVRVELVAHGRHASRDIFQVSVKTLQQTGFVEDVFGPADEASVTRAQVASIGAALYRTVDVVEDYEMDEAPFTERFVDELLDAARTNFKPVAIEEALGVLSGFACDFGKDLKPSTILNELNDSVRIEDGADKVEVVIDVERAMSVLTDRASTDPTTSLGIPIDGVPLSFSSGGGSSSSKGDRRMSLAEFEKRVHDLSRHSERRIHWEREGARFVPKTISVARLQRGVFTNGLHFKRMRMKRRSAALRNVFRLPRSVLSKPEPRVAQRFQLPVGTVLSWVPPRAGLDEVDALPFGWIMASGGTYPAGPLEGRPVPDLNGEGRFVRGGTPEQAGAFESDQVAAHGHHVRDPGHNHPDPGHTHQDKGHSHPLDSVTRRMHKNRDGGNNWTTDDHYPRTEVGHAQLTTDKCNLQPAKTGIVVEGVRDAAAGDETRPKNMRAVFIIKYL